MAWRRRGRCGGRATGDRIGCGEGADGGPTRLVRASRRLVRKPAGRAQLFAGAGHLLKVGVALEPAQDGRQPITIRSRTGRAVSQFRDGLLQRSDALFQR
jgi:hypothetical protein